MWLWKKHVPNIDMEDIGEQVELVLFPQSYDYVFREPHFVHECEDTIDDGLFPWIGHRKTHYDITIFPAQISLQCFDFIVKLCVNHFMKIFKPL